MAVELIYGPKLEKSQTYIFDNIKKSIQNGDKVIYIVPEQYAFSADSLVLEALGEKYSHLTQTINFKRMAKTVNMEYSSEKRDFITEEIRDLVLFNIIRNNAHLLKSVKARRHYSDNVLIFKDVLNELKAHLIDSEKLAEIKENLFGEAFMEDKLNDLCIIMKEYERYTQEFFGKYEDGFETLRNNILKYNLYSDCEIYIDGFVHFSPSEISVIEALMKNCRNIHFTCLVDNLMPHEQGELFYITFKTYENIKRLSENMKLEFYGTYCDDGKNDILEIYEGNYTKKTDCIKATECKNITDEVRFLSYEIKKLTNNEMRYSDISVLCGDMEIYGDYIEKIFSQSDIPFFMDKKVPLIKNPVCRFFVNALNVIAGDFRYEDISCYVKSILFMADEFDSICIFENYISAFKLKKNSFDNELQWKSSFDVAKLGNKYLLSNEEKIEKVYKTLLLPLVECADGLKKKNNPSAYTKCISELIKNLNFQNNLKKYIDNLSDFDKRQSTTNAYNVFLEGIRNIEKICGDSELTIDEYVMLVNQMLEIYKIGVLPNTLDKVTVTDTQRGRDTDKKVVFILGLNDGVTPKNEVESGFLSDIEREKIEEVSNISLPTSKWKNNSSYLSLYRSILSFTQKLYISRCISNEEGNRTNPSFVWENMTDAVECTDFFEKSFVNADEAVNITVQKTLNPFYEKINDENLSKKAYEYKNELLCDIEKTEKEGYFSPDKKIDKKLLDSLYQKKLSTSVSRLEAYQKCGYYYFLQYLLDVKKPMDTQYDYAKTGTILHNVLEGFSYAVSKNELNWDNINEDFIEENVKRLVNREITENFPELNRFNYKTKYLKQKLTRLGKTAIMYIREHYISGSFVPLGYEIPVNNEGVQPLSFALSDGSVMEIYGRIDRADAYKKDDTVYVRIIDYKQKNKDIDFALVKEGISIQLFTYLKTLVDNSKEYFDLEGTVLPGAALYMAYGNKLERFDKKPVGEELEKTIKNKFRLTGIILNDESVLNAIDNDFETKSGYDSDVASISVDKSGKINIKNLLYKEQFDMLLEECESVIRSTGEKIVNGEFYIRPYRMSKKTGCDYCLYKGICYFDKTVHSYKTVHSLTKEDFFKKDEEEA